MKDVKYPIIWQIFWSAMKYSEVPWNILKSLKYMEVPQVSWGTLEYPQVHWNFLKYHVHP